MHLENTYKNTTLKKNISVRYFFIMQLPLIRLDKNCELHRGRGFTDDRSDSEGISPDFVK